MGCKVDPSQRQMDKLIEPEPLSRYLIKDHARFEMKRRGITEEQVRQVLSAPGQVIEIRPGRRIYQAKLRFPEIEEGREKEKEYLLRIVVDMRQPPEVVTVYRTSKISKYWR